MTGPQGGAWAGYPPQGHASLPPSQPSQAEDSGLQARHMGLKVQYTFEKDQQNCLAKWPHVLQIQTIPIDERNAIGLVDLQVCLQAVASCSPEIINRPDKDYAVYALDYSEDDVPLVGQGMLSWALDQPAQNAEQKLVTGKVVKNMLAALRGGPPETLEVKLKLSPVPRLQRPQTAHSSDVQRGYGSNAPTPTPPDSNSEWSSFIQSNPNLGRPPNGPSMPSPSLAPVRYGSPIQALSPAPDVRPDMYANHYGAPTPPTMHAMPVQPMPMSFFPPVPSSQGPAPDDGTVLSRADEPGQPARPKSAKRASSKPPKKRKTTASGKVIGRPRKHDRPEAGNTSAIEDATDAEEAPVEGPKKKRAKTTKADYPNKAPLSSAPGSLRVAASTSGSLRTMRPAAAGGSGVGSSHLQEVPRAPTPVPEQQSRPRSRPPGQAQPRRSSMAEFEGSSSRVLVSETGIPGPHNQDARSPDSTAQSPFQAYTPEESPADFGSSPPVPRSIRSSPPLSSPVLPPMPMPQPDSGFMSGGFDEMVDDYDLQLPVSVPGQMPQPNIPRRSKPTSKSKSSKRKPAVPPPSHGIHRPMSSGLPEPPHVAPPRGLSQGLPMPGGPGLAEQGANGPAQPKQMIIQHEHPGPSELLPKQSIYNPSASAKAQIKKSQAASGMTKAAAQPTQDSQDHLLRLLSEPLHFPQDVEPEPANTPNVGEPTASTTQIADSEIVAPGPIPTAPASDPGIVAPTVSPSTASPEDTAQPSKNMSRKQSIKDKLEKAVKMGQMPTFCSNCGSISTPTWRKIWTQDLDGSPEIPEYSEKPGRITAIVILQRNENQTPTRYRVVKKALGPAEDKSQWVEDILCNPCGLWLSKYQTQRPEAQWEKDYSQIGKSRKKRNSKTSRPKKAKGQGATSSNLPSEAYFTTDPVGPDDQGMTPLTEGDEVVLLRGPTTEPPSRERGARSQTAETGGLGGCPDPRGSTHSRASGSAQSPIAVEDDTLGKTKRLLFPSPKKDGQPKVLGEVAVNIVRTSAGLDGGSKNALTGKENSVMAADMDNEMNLLSTPKVGVDDTKNKNNLADLFSTSSQPSTPQRKERLAGVFKTPTRPTPSHRPITRSVSKSIRTARSTARSPGNAFPRLQGTPTKTPRSSARLRNGSVHYQHPHAHFAADDSMMMHTDFGTPFSSTINQLLSEANDFTAGSSAHGLYELPNMGSDNGLAGHFEGLDFGHFLTTDAVMPSSPPVLRRNGEAEIFDSAEMDFTDWEAFGDVNIDGIGDGDDVQTN
ncbi:hypothetical protein M406DRAFT_349466 [Cryphonectria parasitica EP155]|uniref:Ams2/SPT21 N-terminal domain-containing protein n=1 Tax=Cryphonectria parasitica (strain ATCC 38755 / EP155) TaxID=660469 RepID=A0A9P4YEA9_CRYP1|nr:uncharacterized protein M406DRAFT_349466 [Cryphonectria parasitica EP155]KAF3770940.1 hypothetical protein M406DRAFT_349466 [Cryphonectria parasitica EP155]